VCVEIEEVLLWRDASAELIVDVEVLDVRVLAFVGNLDTCSFVEGHREIAVKGGGAAEFLLFARFDGDGEGERLKVGGHRVAEAEEVADGRDDVSRWRVVPVHLDKDFTVVVWVVVLVVQTKGVVNLHHSNAGLGVGDQARAEDAAAGLHEPEMRKLARSFDIAEGGGLAWKDNECIFVLSGVVPAGHTCCACYAALSYVGQQVAVEERLR
jgi:hypothetical protein